MSTWTTVHPRGDAREPVVNDHPQDQRAVASR
jgi:hypothetical protein